MKNKIEKPVLDSVLTDNIESNQEKDENNENNNQENLNDLGMVNNPMGFNSKIQYLTIIGHIEGHNVLPSQNKTTKYEHIIPQIIAVEENENIEGLLTVLNTVGGDVEAGLAIAELIATISKPTVSLVLGGGHSIGVPLATASDYSFIAESATMTLHPIRTSGLVIGAEQTFNYFKKMQDRIINFITRTADVERDNIVKLMSATDEIANDIGTILIGKETVENGLIDEVGGLKEAMAKLKSLMAENKKEESNK